LDAVGAHVLFADVTSDSATETKAFIAATAVTAAFVAKAITAEFAIIGVFPVHDIPAAVTCDTLPVGERHVGTVRVVGVQNIVDHAEEIIQPALFKCCPDSCCAISFTDSFITDMRVCYIFGCGRRMRIEGFAVIHSSAVQVSELVQFKHNPEWPEVHIVEGNSLCLNREGFVGLLRIYLFKFCF
jgi:hypothetical protein